MAQQQPFAPSFSPFVTPSLLAQQLRMQQTAQFGQQMLQEGQQVPQGQMVSGHFVAPSPFQYAAQLLKTSAGRQAVDSLPDMYGQMVQANQARAQALFGMNGAPQAAPGQPQPSQSGAQAFPVGPSGSPQQSPTPQQPPTAGMQPSPQMLAAGLRGQPQGVPMPSVAPQPQSTIPLLPGKTAEQSFQIFSLLGPQEYMKAVVAQGAPTQDQRNLSFLPSDQRNHLIEGQYLQKATTDGTQRVLGADGRIAAVPVPGYAPAQASLQGGITAAQEGAKADLTPLATVDPATGQTVYRTAGQVVRDAQSGKPAVASRNPITQSSAIKLNDNFVTNDYQPTITAGNSAQEMLSNINAMRSIPITTGWGTDTAAAAANVLTAMGMASDKVSQYASNAQAFNSMAMTQVNKVLNAAKGPQTDQDARRAQQTFASLGNTPQANAFILDYAQAAADMQARKAAYYQQMLPMAQKAGDLTRVSREWQKIQGSIWDDPVMNKWRKEQ